MSKPRNVRNFWIELRIDGRTTRIATGPEGRTGGFDLTIYQRSNGTVTTAMHIEGKAYADGSLQTEARLDQEYWSTGDDALIAASKRDEE